MNFDYTIHIHSRASECRKEGAYAFLVENRGSKEIVGGRIVGCSLTSIRAHLTCVIYALSHTPGRQETILLVSNLEAFVSPFQSLDIKRRLMKGNLPNADLWLKILGLCKNRNVEVKAVSIKTNPPEQLIAVAKKSLEALRNAELQANIDEVIEYPDLFSIIR